ncbi:MAG TPA: hypothetical protein PLJ34_00630 [Hyphomicrobiales bacterium]|nr:hypothetical protein [Hyphomicrobiales bacterium]
MKTITAIAAAGIVALTSTVAFSATTVVRTPGPTDTDTIISFYDGKGGSSVHVKQMNDVGSYSGYDGVTAADYLKGDAKF